MHWITTVVKWSATFDGLYSARLVASAQARANVTGSKSSLDRSRREAQNPTWRLSGLTTMHGTPPMLGQTLAVRPAVGMRRDHDLWN